MGDGDQATTFLSIRHKIVLIGNIYIFKSLYPLSNPHIQLTIKSYSLLSFSTNANTLPIATPYRFTISNPSFLTNLMVLNAMIRSYSFSLSGNAVYGTKSGCFLFASSLSLP